MAFGYDKPWERLTPEEKPNRLHKELRSFIDFYNTESARRNQYHAALARRVSEVEKALKSIEARLDKLEEKAAL